MTQVAFTAPHYLASETGIKILKEGGSAIEAMVAAAACISVAYPHMTGMGGDGFWLIHKPGEEPYAINAAGYAAEKADLNFYRDERELPKRGARAALTVAGVVSGWCSALEWAEENLGVLPHLETLFEDAIFYAEQGVKVTKSLAQASQAKYKELRSVTGYAEVFLENLQPLQEGRVFKQPGQANLLKKLVKNGLQDFYEGEVAKKIADFLEQAGSPIRLVDLQSYHAEKMTVLNCETSIGEIFNIGAPTQGLASLIILGMYDRLYQEGWTEQDKVHCLVECTKQAFLIRDKFITDSKRLSKDLAEFLTDEYLYELCQRVSLDRAMEWPYEPEPGDTIWMGAVDKNGIMVSYIQSLYWEFGCGVTIPEYGLVWSNRGVGFSLDPTSINALMPRIQPFHTLNPAMAFLDDGRRMVYGTMGGEGQPQTQSAIFSRYVYEDMRPETATAEPRWLLGRTWGDSANNLKLEWSLADRVGSDLKKRGHDIEVVPDCSEMMGHAGMLILNTDGTIEKASDPRSDGKAYSVDLGNA